MLILGLNAYHGDSAACVVRDGVVVAAAEEERFRRIKHWAGFPSEAIKFCLKETKAAISDIDILAINSDPRSSRKQKILYTIRNRPGLDLLVDRLRNQVRRRGVRTEIDKAFPNQPFRGSVLRVEHHLSHLASAFLVSPFHEASIASIDGFGDFSSAAWGSGVETSIKIDDRIYFPHSLGIFYQALTQYLGFPNYGDEYKVMGLAPYGRPNYIPQMQEIVKLGANGRFELDLRFFRHHTERISYAWDGGSPRIETLFSSNLESLLGPRRGASEPLDQKCRDIARSVQAMYEEAFFNLLGHLHESHGHQSIALAGGCAMNSVANGKVVRQSRFKQLYVQSAAGDAGGAIGAAIYASYQSGVKPRAQAGKLRSSVLVGDETNRWIMDHAYLGPEATPAEVTSLLDSKQREIEASGCRISLVTDIGTLTSQAAHAIAQGAVVGWFQGRMEWGPRALGNRSIVCDPRRADMKDILNLKIKRRESFRPFAPSVQSELVREWFEEDGDVPFMMQVYQIRGEKRDLIPAVTHVDGSGRLQTVYKETNPRYWELIEAFRSLTSVPMVLNTSFNENEPVVCTPAEALDCFLRTRMDLLVIENFVIRRD